GGALERMPSALRVCDANRWRPTSGGGAIRREGMLTILENAVVLDVEAGELRTESTIIIEGQKIKEITRGAGPNVEARRIDLHGLTVMPGLVDCHAHAMQ